MGELKEELEKIQKRDETLNFRATKAKECLEQFSLPSKKKVAELKEKIQKMEIPRLKEQHIAKIIDLEPKTADEVKTVLQGYTITISQENLKKIADAVKETLE
ncbi:MAG: hypothetical protein QW331_01450 [Candidatus Woesearchaeota archaeon]